MDEPKFVIVSPRQAGGGAIVLHALCKNLENLGYDARILYYADYEKPAKRFPFLRWLLFTMLDTIKCMSRLFKIFLKNSKAASCYINPPIKKCKRKFWPVVDDKTVVVYPETLYGNILKAKNVVRYLLYHYCYKGVPGAYQKSDLFVSYRDVYNDEELNPEKHNFKVSYFDLDLYKRTNFGERQGTCYIIRKGSKRKDLPQKFDGVIVDNYTDEKIVKIFNKCKYCVSYDTQTAYATIAAICGCISIVVPEENKTREDYCKNEEIYGVAYGFSESEIDYAIKTQHLAQERYSKLNLQAKEETKKFVELCKQKFE